jgi:uncharacterized membrane protein
MPPRSHEISRLEAFSDAVFAFALTLLVVSLEVPRSAGELARLMAGFVPFAASFALLTWIWYLHNAFFRRYGLQDPLTVTLNGMLLFVVLFYVYPLKFLFTLAFSFMPGVGGALQVRVGELPWLFAVYGLGFVSIFVLFALLYVRAHAKREELGLDAAEVREMRLFAGAHLVSAGVGLLSVLVALLAPVRLSPFAGFVYFLMGPAHYAYGTWMARRRRAATEGTRVA